MPDHPNYQTEWKDPRETIDPRNYILEVDRSSKNALSLATGIDPAQNAAIHAQVALAHAIAGLAAAILATGTVKPGDDR